MTRAAFWEFAPGRVVPGTSYRVQQPLDDAGPWGCAFDVCDIERGTRGLLTALPATAELEPLMARLKSEWDALARLRHRAVARVVATGRSPGGVHYLVQERLSGESLEARLRRQTRLPIRQALSVGIDIAHGLAAAHDLGILHLGLTASRVWFDSEGGPKILGLGMAPLEALRSRGVSGMGADLAPEQSSGLTVDARSDLYAVGVILFRAISGVDPDGVARLSQLAEGVSALLETTVARLLASDPRDRPTSARQAAIDLTLAAQSCSAIGQAEEEGKRGALADTTLVSSGALASVSTLPSGSKSTGMDTLPVSAPAHSAGDVSGSRQPVAIGVATTGIMAPLSGAQSAEIPASRAVLTERLPELCRGEPERELAEVGPTRTLPGLPGAPRPRGSRRPPSRLAAAVGTLAAAAIIALGAYALWWAVAGPGSSPPDARPDPAHNSERQ